MKIAGLGNVEQLDLHTDVVAFTTSLLGNSSHLGNVEIILPIQTHTTNVAWVSDNITAYPNTDGLITMLYVLPQCAGRAYGSNLLQVMRGYAKDDLNLSRTLVNATPAWTSVYFKKQGYLPINNESALGVPFVPMQAFSNSGAMQKKEKISVLTVVFAILGCIGFATIAGVLFMLSYIFS